MIINLRGKRFAYDEQGTGIPILFIHGFPLNKALWEPQIGSISKVYKTVSIDLRGHGETQAIPGPYSMEMLARDCNDLLDGLGIKNPVFVCGLSMGGYVTMEFTRLYPSRVAGAILTATRSRADTVEGKANRDKAITTACQHGVVSIVDSMLPKMFAQDTYISTPDLVGKLREIMMNTSLDGAIGALQGMKNRTDFTHILTTIKVPTLIIHGTDDQLIPLHVAQEMQAANQYSTLIKVPNAGHLLNWEKPEIFNQAIMDFLSASSYS